MIAQFAEIGFPLFAQQNPPEVSYNVAFIAAGASVAGAILAAAIAVANVLLTRKGQKDLQILQADLVQKNQKELTNLQTKLKLEADLELEKTRSNLAEKTQTRLETIKAEFAAQNQQELEFLRANLGEQGKDRDARRDYQYDAHKRLYAECEPLLFQLAELSEHALYRIFSLARASREGRLPNWLSCDDYYRRSTLYKLIAPLVVFRLIQQRLTFVDLTLDKHIANQYRLLKVLYLTFTDAFVLAGIGPVDYDPDVDDWEEQRKTNPRNYWRQGMYLGVLDNTIDALLVSDETPRVKTFGVFESEFRNEDSTTHTTFLTFVDILDGFHPTGRPILWRMLWTQSLIYKKILETQSSSRMGWAEVSPKLPAGDLDWRQDEEEASDEETLKIPERVAQEYLQSRLPEVFGKPTAIVP